MLPTNEHLLEADRLRRSAHMDRAFELRQKEPALSIAESLRLTAEIPPADLVEREALLTANDSTLTHRDRAKKYQLENPGTGIIDALRATAPKPAAGIVG